jgi:hypothetical protein
VSLARVELCGFGQLLLPIQPHCCFCGAVLTLDSICVHPRGRVILITIRSMILASFIANGLQ